MADLSEQQVMIADSAAGGRQEASEREKGRIREFMEALFRHVSEEDRLLLTLKEVEGLSLKELESIYNVNENALKVRLFRARQRVLKAYKLAAENGKM
jgi:RNA polymerase sigma-70 factor (ECF subfamily)